MYEALFQNFVSSTEFIINIKCYPSKTHENIFISDKKNKVAHPSGAAVVAFLEVHVFASSQSFKF